MRHEITGEPRTAPRKVAFDEVPVNKHRGGALRTLLGPGNVGATSGFMGHARLEPGEYISEHYHPYSEEFVYVLSGAVVIRLDGQETEVGAQEGILVPIEVRHRLENRGDVPAELVYHLGPLAPRPDLGHVDTEELPFPGLAPAGEPR
ncbi:cupin domain-containing protein [Streptomyces sp. CRN 30]|uniref:cupin domain-containing protein n=1 Tax=Streptomyces sp. CRN 30 TaxID=3075613 RepID=UPI002A8337D5|nr:cupin domain-containing protein [Streptomyces sp. CRN 30]